VCCGLPILDILWTTGVHEHGFKAKMNSLRAPTNRRRYNVELRIYDTSNNDDGPDLVSLAQVPLGTIQLWIDEFGRPIDDGLCDLC
jgi:hypothetical protein